MIVIYVYVNYTSNKTCIINVKIQQNLINFDYDASNNVYSESF